MVSAAAALVIGFALRGRWWVLHIRRDELDQTIARACRMVLATSNVTAEGVRVRLAQTDLSIHMRPLGTSAFELSFEGPWRAHRKAILLLSVIAKQFDPPLPRIRIRLRRVR
jgi:hypothetical protein